MSLKAIAYITAFMFSAGATASVQLAQSWQWKKVLQYNEKGYSEVKQGNFFFSLNGHQDPAAELRQTLSAFKSGKTAICRFPARHMLTTKAGLTEAFNYTECNDFITWQQSRFVDKAALVFADGYLKNPASFHGHLFITLSGEQSSSGLLDNSLNFGASVPPGVNPVTYILKGLFGGYQARYSAQPFYRHNLSYGQIELRNLWDYELNLSDFDAQLLSAHLFELSETEYTYYFTSKNCAYYVARAIEIVADDYLVSDDELTVFPSEIVQRIAEPKRDLVRSVTLNESEQKRFQSRYHALAESEKLAARGWANGNPHNPAFNRLSKAGQKRVLITLSSYFEFQRRQQPDSQQHFKNKRVVLMELLKHPAGNSHKQEPVAEQPHLGQKPNMVRISRVLHSGEADRWELTYRPTYYDRLQPKIGKPKHSGLTMGELALSYADNKLSVESLTLIDITSFNVSSTGLPGDGGQSWAIKAGADRKRLRDTQPDFSGFVEGAYGAATDLTAGAIGYALVSARLHDKEVDGDSHNVTLAAKFGVEGKIANKNWFCEVSSPLSVADKVKAQDWITRCGANLLHGTGFDLRLTLEKQNFANYLLGFSYYF
ncbi:DUF4105 domain-containing protein [Idiomarina seosinensis]|uniref:Lnb N-terminal periplasmic domain-containing protein n=1 Tax=Idiomarina seosinensis TaxID=281739 RepID=UPI00384EC5C5